MALRILVGLTLAATAVGPRLTEAQSTDEQAVLAVVHKLFDGMRAADTAVVRSVFIPGARFALIDARATPPAIRFDSVDGWIRAVGNSAKRWDEQIYDVQVRVDGHMAQVWAPYTFYLDKKVRHCGVDAIELLRDGGGWRVTQLSDTQRREGCRDPLARPSPPIMGVFAHPDDERVIGPMLHRLSREGREVHLVIATDGSKGVRDHAGIAAGKPLADARKLEAECAAKRLGVRQLHFVGLEDGGLASFTNLVRLRTELTGIIARVQPAAIITFGPEGGTGHPDHRLVGNVVTEIVQRDSLPRPVDLLYASLPAERLRTAPRASPTVNGVAESLLTVRVPFEEQDLVAGRESFACHRSQYTAAEMQAINAYLAHAYNGVNYLRPWNGAMHASDNIFRDKH